MNKFFASLFKGNHLCCTRYRYQSVKHRVTVSNANIHHHLLQFFLWTANSRMLISIDMWMYNLSGGTLFRYLYKTITFCKCLTMQILSICHSKCSLSVEGFKRFWSQHAELLSLVVSCLCQSKLAASQWS